MVDARVSWGMKLYLSAHVYISVIIAQCKHLLDVSSVDREADGGSRNATGGC